MKNRIATLGFGILLCCACGSSDKQSETMAKNDTTLVTESEAEQKTATLTAKMQLTGKSQLGQPISIRFTVYNFTDTTAKFCKWHTPFERLSSKYLDVALEDHTEISYVGPMAKRIMPPPADSYATLKKGDSTSVEFNLADAYSIRESGDYTIKYNSTNISGIVVPDSLKIHVEN